MTANINDDLNIPVHPLGSTSAVVVIAEHDLTDVALCALIEGMGYSVSVVDVDVPASIRPSAKAVIVRSGARLDEIIRQGLFSGARVIGVNTPVAHVNGVGLPDSPYAVGSLQQVLRSVAGSGPGVTSRVHLSPREREVVVTYTLGATVRDTAAEHFIAESTVRSHFRRVVHRYGEAGRPVNNKTQLLLALIADGWVDRDQLRHLG